MALVLRLLVCVLATLAALPAGAAILVYGYRVVHTYRHDPQAFTEGLFYRDGFLYESTGLPGRSSVRKVRLETGEVLQRVDLPESLFGEGIVDWGDRLIGLTWQSQIGFVLGLKKFDLVGRFGYLGEGWGLTHDDRELVMSDGTAELRFLDPMTLLETHRLRVTADGEPVTQLNELEWVDGEFYANVWQTDRIARIDPHTGHVVGWIDLAGLLGSRGRGREDPDPSVDVLNGIAWDAATKRLFVRGKFWPKVFEIRLVIRPPQLNSPRPTQTTSPVWSCPATAGSRPGHRLCGYQRLTLPAASARRINSFGVGRNTLAMYGG